MKNLLRTESGSAAVVVVMLLLLQQQFLLLYNNYSNKKYKYSTYYSNDYNCKFFKFKSVVVVVAVL